MARSAPPTPRSLTEYIDAQQARGKYWFSLDDVRSVFAITDTAFRQALRRLQIQRRIVAPRRGFFVIVPLEHAISGSPPADWFIDALMQYQRRPYYVSLLTAAALHGAAHQQPQEFEIITDRPQRISEFGRVRLRFFVKSTIKKTPIQFVKTTTGTMRVSTPESTALDLVRYGYQIADLGHIATILHELSEKIDAEKLTKAAHFEQMYPVAQRLGFLLEFVERSDLTETLYQWVRLQKPRVIALRPDKPSRRARLDTRWRIRINEKLELEH